MTEDVYESKSSFRDGVFFRAPQDERRTNAHKFRVLTYCKTRRNFDELGLLRHILLSCKNLLLNFGLINGQNSAPLTTLYKSMERTALSCDQAEWNVTNQT